MSAEEALKKLEEQLTCPICLDTYTDPKLLPCHHVYCRKCLVKLVIRDEQGDLVLTCPHCRQVTPVLPRGVAGLQSAFHINHLLEIQDSLQKLRIAPISMEGAVGGDSSLNAVSKAGYCSDHGEKELELYCETCGKLICCYCAIKGGKHHCHDHELLGKAYEKYNKEISLSFEPMERQLAVTNKALAKLVTRKWKITDQQAVIEADIHNTMRRLREILYARETSLIDELHQMTQAKLKELAMQKNQLETTQAQLRSCLEFMKESLKTGSQGEVLRTKTTIVKQVKELTTTLYLEPKLEKATIVFSILSSFEKDCLNIGQLIPTVNASSELEMVKRVPSQVFSEFAAPWGVAINHRGEIIVTDSEGQRISILMSSGQRLKSFGEGGFGPGQFRTPYGVAVDAEGNILVVDCHNHRIQKFTCEGNFLTTVGTAGVGALQFKEPKDIVFNFSNSKLYVVDDNCRVQILNSDLTFFDSFGSRGSGEGQFIYPCGITCDNHGNVYVVDFNDRVQVFTAEGVFKRMFGKSGNGQGELNLPIGIAVHKGLVYVSEYHNHRVSVFTCDGQFVVSFGRGGSNIGEFDSLGNLAVHNETLYVCDRYNYRVQAFSI